MLSAQPNSLSQKLKDQPIIKVVESLALWATSKKLPFVVYRLPNQPSYSCLIGSEITQVNDEDLSSIASGFLVSSYEGEQYFINDGIKLNSKDKEITISTTWPSNISIRKTWQSPGSQKIQKKSYFRCSL